MLFSFRHLNNNNDKKKLPLNFVHSKYVCLFHCFIGIRYVQVSKHRNIQYV